MSAKREKIIMIRLTKQEHRALFKVAKELDQPVSTVARQIIMRAIQPGVMVEIPSEGMSEVFREIAESEPRDGETERETALKQTRAMMAYIQDQLEKIELEDAVRDSERDDEN